MQPEVMWFMFVCLCAAFKCLRDSFAKEEDEE